jgi:hypothetical protein
MSLLGAPGGAAAYSRSLFGSPHRSIRGQPATPPPQEWLAGDGGGSSVAVLDMTANLDLP